MSAPAPSRYCLAVCYCGDCPHYRQIKRTSERDDLGETIPVPKSTTWEDREESTWIDKL